MDVQGIDQVMIIPTSIDTYPWLQNALGARAMCKAYNDWAYEYTREDPERLYFAALIPMQNPQFAVEEVYRVAAMGCRVALIRPMDAMGNYPIQPKYEGVWNALEDTGLVYGMHPFPASGVAKPPGYSDQYSGAELIRKTISTSGLPHTLLGNVQNFQAEASLWVTMVLMSGFFERHPKIRAAVFEASSTWLSFLLDECDKTYRLYRNDRNLPPLTQLPSETFFQHCVTGFEGDEAPRRACPTTIGTSSPGPPTSITTTETTLGGPSRPWKNASCPSTTRPGSWGQTLVIFTISSRPARSFVSASPRSTARIGGPMKTR